MFKLNGWTYSSKWWVWKSLGCMWCFSGYNIRILDHYETCTVGTNVKIPCIRRDFKEEEWKSMAKILYVGWVNSKYFPIKLAISIIEQMLYGHVNSKLIPIFLLTLGENDNQILNSAMKDISSVDEDDLLEAFSTLECRTVPNENNLVKLLEEISHKELIQKPHFIIEQFRR